MSEKNGSIPSSPFSRETMQDCRNAIRKIKKAAKQAHDIFLKEVIIGAHQCSLTIKILEEECQSITSFYDIVRQAPRDVPKRYDVLISLDNAIKLIRTEALPLMKEFHDLILASTIYRQILQTMVSQRVHLINIFEKLDQVLQQCQAELNAAYRKSVHKLSMSGTLDDTFGQAQDPPLDVPYNGASIDTEGTSKHLLPFEEPARHMTEGQTVVVPPTVGEDTFGSEQNSESAILILLNASRTDIRRAIWELFDIAELELLCDDVGVPFEDMGEGPIELRIKHVMSYCIRHNIYEKLIKNVWQRRSDNIIDTLYKIKKKRFK